MARSQELSRRGFLGRGVGLSAASVAAPYFMTSNVLAAPGRKGANDKINVGIIGTGSLTNGWHFPQLLKQQDVVIAGLCDVWQERLDKAVERCKAADSSHQAKPHHDYRELLARDDIDAVLIATPPHWHALMAIHAAEAGKDFYLEKPMTLHVAESLAVHRAALKHQCITQIGTQVHASDNYRRVVEYVRSGQLGKINMARVFMVMNQGPEGIGNEPHCDPPADLDWDLWVGPARKKKYHPAITKNAYTHSSFMTYSGGWTPGMGPHLIDLPYWALELGFPKRTSSCGGRYLIADVGDAQDTHEVLWEYGNFAMTWSMSLINSYGHEFQGPAKIKRRHGIYFQGVNGTLLADYGTMRVVPEGDRMAEAKTPAQSIPQSKGHHREWLDAIRTREQPLCNVSYHYKMDVAITLANLAQKLNRVIRFDSQTERIVGDPEAARYMMPVYREPYQLPSEYL